jgi:hypothetical protein
MKIASIVLALVSFSGASASTVTGTIRGGGSSFCKENPTDELCYQYRQGRSINNYCSDRDLSGGDPRCTGNTWRRGTPNWDGNDPRWNGAGN